MINWLHEILVFFSRILGTWFFSMVSWIIATGYYVFIPARVFQCSRVYRALYPARGTIFHLRCVWRQYHNFTLVILDRMLLLNYGNISFTSQGWEHVLDAVRGGKGGVIVMSHMGNWDVAAHLLGRENIPLLLYMGVKEGEQLEKMQKRNLSEGGITIVAVGKDGGSLFEIIEGLHFLKKGGLVAITGDIVWSPKQRTVDVDFLGHRVALPAAPFVLAQKTGAPVLFFFAFRSGPRSYEFVIRDPLMIPAEPRGRTGELQAAVQNYADILADELARHPFEWYHFHDFLGTIKPGGDEERNATDG